MGNKVIERRTYEDWKLFCEHTQNSNTVNLAETKQEQEARINKALAPDGYNFFVKTYFDIYADVDCAEFHTKAAAAICVKKRPTKDPNLIAILEWPREHAKSVHADILIPLWMLAKGTLNGMILMGKNEDDACNLLGDIQAQLQHNPLFIHDFGQQFNFGDWQAGDFTTKGGIRFMAVGRNQSPRGARKGQRRPNYAVVDDVDDDELVENQKRVRKIVKRILGALFFALDTRGCTLVIAGNRIHPQSVLAHMVGDIKPGAPKRDGIYHSKIFAIDPKTGKPAWPERYTLDMINSKVKAAGIYGRVEFFHEHHVEGAIFKESMFHWIKMWHLLKEYQIIVGYFDPSLEDNPTSDFKAVRVWGGYVTGSGDWQRHCLKSFVRREVPIIEAFQWMSEMDDRMPPGVGIVWYVEKQFYNRPIQDALFEHNKKRRKEGKRELIIITDTRAKEKKYTRMVKMEPAYSNNENYFNIDELYNPDMLEGNNQLKGVEPGYNTSDDSPDSDEGAWYYLDQHKTGRNFKPKMIKPKRKRGW